MDFPSGQHHFASGQHLHITFVKKTLKHFLFRTKESLTFLRDYIILPPEKKIDKKILHPSVSQSSHDLLGNKSPLSHFSSWTHISSRMPSYIQRTLPFKITFSHQLKHMIQTYIFEFNFYHKTPLWHHLRIDCTSSDRMPKKVKDADIENIMTIEDI